MAPKVITSTHRPGRDNPARQTQPRYPAKAADPAKRYKPRSRPLGGPAYQTHSDPTYLIAARADVPCPAVVVPAFRQEKARSAVDRQYWPGFGGE